MARTKPSRNDDLEILRAYRADPQRHASDCIFIRDHNTSKIMPLVYNDPQKILHTITEKQLAEKGIVRILLLKTRRFGGSTYVQGRFYSKTSLNFNRNAFIVGHEKESTDTLFEMAKLMQERNPIAPATKASNQKCLKFDDNDGNGLKSEYRLATAENVDAGRSQGIHFLHDCLHGDSLIVLSSGGSKKISEISPSDQVVTGSGAFADVVKVFKSGIKNTYSVSTWLNNQPVIMSSNHKVFTIDGIKKCKHLDKSDWVLVPTIPITGKIKTYKFEIKNKQRYQGGGSKHAENVDVNFDRGFGYYLGYYLADGCVKKQYVGGKPCAVHFAYHECENYIDRAYNWFAKKYSTSRSDFSDETKRKRTYFYGSALACLTESICGSVERKHIPNWFFDTNRDFLFGLVEGYFDGDGCKNQDRKSAVCIREKISRQIRRIIMSLGYGVPAIRYTDNRERYGKKTSPIYTVDCTGDTFARLSGMCVIKPNKSTKYRESNGKYYVKIRSIRPFGKAETYDIEVDHPDHNFETTIGVVSNSEEAFWRDPKKLLTGLIQCLPDPPAYSEAFRESTGNGYGNQFQEDVFKAYGEGQYVYYSAKLCNVISHMPDADIDYPFAWRQPSTDWVLVFIPWFAHDRYQRTFDADEQRDQFESAINEKVFDSDKLEWVESEPSKLRRKYGLTLEQLHWREWAIENKCNGDVRKFHQEYPATVEEAFLSTGTNVYPQELCDQIEDGCEQPFLTGDLTIKAGKARIRPNKFGKFEVWEHPDQHKMYFMTVDPGGGMNQRQRHEKADPDPTCIDIYDHRSGAQVAQWHGHIAYDLIADIVEMAGRLYNNATACVELQNHGYTVVADLKRRNYPQYEWKPGEPGWSTNSKTKPIMVDDLYRMARDGLIQIKSKPTVSEMRTFVEQNGKYGAAPGCHDERVDTAGMATQMLQVLQHKLSPSEMEYERMMIQPEEEASY
jgi:hypothetical protein